MLITDGAVDTYDSVFEKYNWPDRKVSPPPLSHADCPMMLGGAWTALPRPSPGGALSSAVIQRAADAPPSASPLPSPLSFVPSCSVLPFAPRACHIWHGGAPLINGAAAPTGPPPPSCHAVAALLTASGAAQPH